MSMLLKMRRSPRSLALTVFILFCNEQKIAGEALDRLNLVKQKCIVFDRDNTDKDALEL